MPSPRPRPDAPGARPSRGALAERGRRPASAPGGRLPHRRPVAALGVSLLVVTGGAWIAFGGVHHGTRAALHLALAGGFALAASLTDRSLRYTGRMLPLAAASAALWAACAVGLVPLPRGLLAWVAPGRASEGWSTLSIDAEATVGELCDLALPLGALVLAATWGAAWWRRSGIERAMRVALVAVLLVAVGHAASGRTELFGVIGTSLVPPQRFFAPFIDPNHAGTALAMLLPAPLATTLDPRAAAGARLGWGAAALAALAAIVWVGSSGAVLAAGVAAVLVAWRTEWIPRAATAAFGLAVLAAAGPWLWLADAGAGATFHERVATWRGALATLPGFWLAGAGGGTFQRAIQPHVDDFVLWGHAHQDLLEWILEHGLVGVAALAAALWWSLGPADRAAPAAPESGPASLPPEDDPTQTGERGSARWVRRADVLTISVVAVLVHALVDFPLQIPALAMAAAALWGLRRTAFAGRVDAAPGPVRRVLGVALVVQLGAAGWEARTAAVTRAVDGVWAQGPSAGGRVTLARLAPWRPEGPLLDAWRAQQAGRLDAAAEGARGIVARHRDDPRALRAAARVLARAGAAGEGWDAYTRAIERFPGDWRTRVARAVDAPADRQVAAWQDAFAHGAPAAHLPQAWAALPLGLVWVEAATARDAAFQERLGVFLESRADPESAALAYEQARLTDPTRFPPGYARALVALGRHAEAAAYLAAAVAARPHDLELQRQEAELLEARGAFADAAEVWLAIGSGLDGAAARGLRAVERARGAEAALQIAERLSLAGPLDGHAVLEVARLERDTGDLASCTAAIDAAGLLASRRFGARARSLRASCLP